jgi:hypothetical protein
MLGMGVAVASQQRSITTQQRFVATQHLHEIATNVYMKSYPTFTHWAGVWQAFSLNCKGIFSQKLLALYNRTNTVFIKTP